MNETASQVEITLVSGYLGAGKTTLLNRLLANDREARIAVIVNDIGEVNIDADLIADQGLSQADSVIPLTNGCICCTLSDDLAAQLGDLANSGSFDHVVIEASGICEPMPIAYTISEFCRAQQTGARPIALDNIVAVVDCARMVDEFEAGRSLLMEGLQEDDVENLLVQQIEFCTTLVLNKVDLVDRAHVQEMRALVRSLQKDAVIVEAVEGDVPLGEILHTGRFDFDKVYRSAAWLDTFAHGDAGHAHGHAHAHDDHGQADGSEHGHAHGHEHAHAHDHSAELLEYGISTFVYERRRPFSVDAFAGFTQAWPDTVIRTKGFAWVDQYPDNCFILEQAGRQRKFSDNGPFVTSLPAEEQERALAQNPGIRDRWDEKLGDRMTRLVFIGRNMDRAAIEAQLDACLTDWE